MSFPAAVEEPQDASDRRSDYSVLSRRIRDAGLMRRRHGYYTAVIATNVALYLGTWAVFPFLGDSWYQLLTAVVLAVLSTQIAFTGHEVGHRQIFRGRRASEVAGLTLGNLGIGLGIGWWVDKHNRHHSHPNHVDRDPDIAEGALSWTEQQVGKTRGLRLLWTRWQGRLFFPLLLLAGLNLHVSSFRALPTLPPRRRWLEGGLLVVHFAAYLSALFLVLSPGKAIAFFFVHKCLFGLYMGSTFAPNHKGMPILQPGEKIDFFRRQVLTSRNVTGGRFLEWGLGGLNYQIEHHLFPSMPRPALRHARPIVIEFCQERGVPYHETNLIQSWREILTYLDEVGNSRAIERAVPAEHLQPAQRR
ncbi:acyl-CoA desaturase [Actinoalloteichus sp. AHMU CJ021]|uniref:Fatty acid desaturase n=1 Tax=Actinoalloteichus caeruleus DSM 43889 TaxID=1120930 RepID=A0ABT1JD47_ACTCY|nr:acyl-CoA desaturase [Actinoalloteichus caeruleus]AUS80961.1 acyl-CoA desaturase [Actinoalloteichus sp. AHMU CJ021]MCP2330410.1 Fatty acid desaturase [Actinoalloteichus caeruleus DSM 43889]